MLQNLDCSFLITGTEWVNVPGSRDEMNKGYLRKYAHTRWFKLETAFFTHLYADMTLCKRFYCKM